MTCGFYIYILNSKTRSSAQIEKVSDRKDLSVSNMRFAVIDLFHGSRLERESQVKLILEMKCVNWKRHVEEVYWSANIFRVARGLDSTWAGQNGNCKKCH